MALRDDILNWDGKSAAGITDTYEAHANSRGFLGRLIALSGEPECEVGATWLVKHHIEAGASMNADQTDRWYALAPGLTEWGAKLHLLQCMPAVPVPSGHARRIERWLSACLTIEQKFVRAWALSGYADLARAHPRYHDQAIDMLEDARENDPAASVRARARQVLKAGTRG
ncbi:MAG: hypothetical protein ED559_00155 [Phycisphaera sp.]|nr:MAG: hypothetical protein ED559_00155 [Phycisphaera sp.]